MGILQDGVRQLYDMGILDIILPFILIFTLIFAVLQRTKILGQTKKKEPLKNFNVVISLVFATAAVIPHVLWGTGGTSPRLSNGFIDVVQIINNALPSISLIVVVVLAFLIVVGIWGKNIDIGGSSLGGIVMVVSILAVIFIFTVASGFVVRLPNWLYWLRNPQTQALIVVILIFGILIRFIVGPSDDDDKKKDEPSSMEKLGKLLKDA